MGIITSNYSAKLDGKTDVKVGEDTYAWNERQQLYAIDILSDFEGPTLTARLTLAGKSWFLDHIHFGDRIDAVIDDKATGTADSGLVTIGVISARGLGTNTITLRNAEADIIRGGQGRENVSVGYWAAQIYLGTGDDKVTLTGAGEVGSIDLGRGNDVVKTASGLLGTVYAGRQSDTVLLGKGGADFIDLGRDADTVKLSMLADKGQAVVLSGGEGVSSSTDKDSDTVDFSAFSGKLTVDLNGQATVKSGHGNFYIRNFENAFGGSGKDVLVANTDANLLKGNGGADHFVFKTAKAAAGDTILDFSRSQKDKIDLGAMDASTKSGGDQDFTFIGTAGFHKKAGELRYEKKGGDTLVHGDVNGDGKADFSITIDASLSLKASDFIL